MNRNLRTAIERRNFGRGFELHLYTCDGDDGLASVAEPITFRKVDDPTGAHDTPAAVTLDHRQAQALADQLWEAGFRPTQGQQSEGQHGAMNAHLQDMRHMVAVLSKVDLPGTK